MKKLAVLALVVLILATCVSASTAKADEGRKLVCITFDDGWQNQYDNALPILNLYGFKATFAVVTNWIGTGTAPEQCMSDTELHTLANQGMDIASHTRNHRDYWPNMDTSELQDEVAGSKTDLEQAGFIVRTFVYPYYEYNDDVIAIVKNAGYICARSGARNDPYDPGNIDPDARYTVDAIEINETQDITAFQSIVDPASENSVICLNYHSVSDAGLPTPYTPVANFSEQMAYLSTHSFTVVLLPDLMPPTIALSPTSMTFTGIQDGSNPAAQTLNISNSGGGTLTWSASDNADWLTLAPTSGSAPSAVTVTADTAGLSAGTYNATITITATDATNTPQTVPVTLTVEMLPDWNYRKQITIAGSTAGAQTNYPMKVTINRADGTDSGSTVYLGTRCASDYKDIRFTTGDGRTLLDYWVESSDSATATIWVEFDSIPASASTASFYLYYGNSGATSASNIKNTFDFADDFEDGTVDTSRWTTGGDTGGSVTEANGALTVTAGTSSQEYAASINKYTNGYALHARAKLDSVTGCSSYRLLGFVTTLGTYTDSLFTTTYRWYYADPNFWAVSGDGSTSTQANMNVVADTNYHISECLRYAASGTNYDRFIIDDGAEVDGANPTTTPRYIYINSDEYGKSIIVDWIFLRKFVSPEPTWGAWGNEETPANTITASAGANGSISPSGDVIVASGASQAFTITPNTGYHVADVLVDGSSVGAVTSYTFTNVIANHTIAASFAINRITEISAFTGSTGMWYLDYSGDGHWSSGDLYYGPFGGGTTPMTPVTGDWNGDGYTEIIAFKGSTGMWYIDYSGDGHFGSGDLLLGPFGGGTIPMTPVTGDWNHDGHTEIGAFTGSSGYWYLDYSGDGHWSSGDLYYGPFGGGTTPMTPVTGDWNHDGYTEIGAFMGSTGMWYLDYSGDGHWSSGDLYYGPFGS